MNRAKKFSLLVCWVLSFCCNECEDLFHSLTCGFFRSTQSKNEDVIISPLDVQPNGGKNNSGKNYGKQLKAVRNTNFLLNREEKGKILTEKEKELNNKIKEQEIIKNDLNKEKNKLIKEKNILDEKKKKLNIKEQEIINKKNQLATKEQEMKKKINETKLLKSKYEKEQKELNEKNEKIIQDFKKKENNYKLEIKKLNDIIADFKEPIFVGLNNIGATCYMNATLQCLSNTKKLTDFFLKNFKDDDPKKIMSNEYYKVIKNLWKRENNKMSYSPYSFKEVLSKENPLFAGIAANDSKDLINFLLERFHQELNIINNNINNNVNDNLLNLDQTNENLMLKSFLDEYTQKFNSIISNLFYGILETKSQCKGCNMIKFNFQVFSFIEFPLEQVNLYFYNKGKRPLILSNGENPDIDLYECFEYNQKIDLMTGENQMFCNICNKLCDSYYATTTYSYPNYLIINLNRGKGAVYKCKVNFPKQLNVINYATFKQGFTVFELYAVICHLGPSSMSGHFVAYCKNSIDHKWYLYNDAFVTLCSKPFQYNDGMPYILFYKALTLD